MEIRTKNRMFKFCGKIQIHFDFMITNLIKQARFSNFAA